MSKVSILILLTVEIHQYAFILHFWGTSNLKENCTVKDTCPYIVIKSLENIIKILLKRDIERGDDVFIEVCLIYMAITRTSVLNFVNKQPVRNIKWLLI